ncbi:MAG: class II fumarate hydratase [Thermoguttaceae bacterium]
MRTEHDTMGSVQLPQNAYYGAQTQRAIDHFPISGRPLPAPLIHALGLLKRAAAQVNDDLDLFSQGPLTLSDQERDALKKAAAEVAEGFWDAEFPVDIYQTGSGTSTNMNVNEVIANRATELCGGDRFAERKRIHPNDHVNLGQSTNDMFPSAIHIALAAQIQNGLLPALRNMERALKQKSENWQNVLKIGRTHLADATPMTLGQEFGGFARQIEGAVQRSTEAMLPLLELPAGGTAVGSGLNTHPQFGKKFAETIAAWTKIPFTEAKNHFEANAQRDGIVTSHALLKSVAVTLFNVANNIRWLASGPRCGYFEIRLPDLQPGSSIMPGKVNPVLCESMMQLTARVIGNDQTISFCGATGGQFQLNIMMPVIAETSLESVLLLTNGTKLFTEKCLVGIEANEEKCIETIEQSLSMVTALNPLIGYEKAAELAKEAFKTGKTIRSLCLEKEILPPEILHEALDPRKMAGM